MTDLRFVGVNTGSGNTVQKQADPDSDALLLGRVRPSGGTSGAFTIDPVAQVSAGNDLLVIEDGNSNQILVVTADVGVGTGTLTGSLTISQDLTVSQDVLLASGVSNTVTLARGWSDNAVDFSYAASATLDPSTSPAFGSGGSVDIIVGTGTADPDVTGVAAGNEGSLLLVTDGTAWIKTGANPTDWTQLASSVQSTLDGVITGGTPDNDVNIPTGDPLIYRDNAVAGFDILTFERTGAGAGDAIAVTLGASATGAGIDIDISGASQGITIDASTSTNPLMTLTKSGGSGIGMAIDVNAIAAGRGMNITHGASGTGISMSDGTSATTYNALSINPVTAFEVRPTVSGGGNGFDLTISGGTGGTGLSDNGGDLILIGGNGNTSGVDGDVLIGNLTTTNAVTIAPAGAITATAGTPATGTGSTGSNFIVSVGAGADAGSGNSAGPGGSLLLIGGNGGASDGTDAANDGGFTSLSAGDGGDGSGTIPGGTGGNVNINSGAGGNVGASGDGADAGAVAIIAGDGSDAATAGDGGNGGDINIQAGTSGDGAGAGDGFSGGGVTITAGDGGAGNLSGAGGNIRLEVGNAGAATAAQGEVQLALPKQDGDTTPSFKYVEAVTIEPTGAGTLTSGVAVYVVADDPNSEVTAEAGSIALDDEGRAWVNTDGTNTGWDELLTVASGAPSLDDAITSAGVVDNDVDVPSGDPVIFRDGAAAGFDILTVSRTGVGAGDAIAVTMGPGGEATTGSGISITEGSGSQGFGLEINHDSSNPSQAIFINATQLDAANAIRIDQTAPTVLFTEYGILGITYGGQGPFAEFFITGNPPPIVGGPGRDIRLLAADGADGDGGTAAGTGGAIDIQAGDSGADLGGGGAVGADVTIEAGLDSTGAAGAGGTISIGSFAASGILIGNLVGGAQVLHDSVAGSAGAAVTILNTSTPGPTSGSYSIGVNTSTFVNVVPGNPDLQATLEALDVGLGTVTLQDAYAAGNAVAVTTGDGSVALSNSADVTDLLTLSRTFAGAGDAIDITMGAGATGDALVVTMGDSGDTLEIDDSGGTAARMLVTTGSGDTVSYSGYGLTYAGESNDFEINGTIPSTNGASGRNFDIDGSDGADGTGVAGGTGGRITQAAGAGGDSDGSGAGMGGAWAASAGAGGGDTVLALGGDGGDATLTAGAAGYAGVGNPGTAGDLILDAGADPSGSAQGGTISVGATDATSITSGNFANTGDVGTDWTHRGNFIIQGPGSSAGPTVYGLSVAPQQQDTEGTVALARFVELDDTTSAIGGTPIIVLVDDDPDGQVTSGDPGSLAIDPNTSLLYRKRANTNTWVVVQEAPFPTAVQTGNFTADVSDRVLYDPSGGTFQIDAPSSPSFGDRWSLKNTTTDTTSVTIDGNGNNIEDPGAMSFAASFGLATALVSLDYLFDGTNWVIV